MKLDVHQHDRDSDGLRYVYSVVSRRSGGVSVGVNLNPNNACNFRCVYCQVPNLSLGKAPPIDLPLLERELRGLLTEVLHGDFMQRRVPSDVRRLNDVALSGNGEPTSSDQFHEVVALVGEVLRDHQLVGEIELVLITNGSYTERPHVEQGIRAMKELNGVVWFKLDSVTREGSLKVNSSKASVEQRLERLARVAELCPTWVQTCLFARGGEAPSEHECQAYLAALERLLRSGTPLRGVLLYGLARPSMQLEAPELSRLDPAWMEAMGARVAALGLPVKVTP